MQRRKILTRRYYLLDMLGVDPQLQNKGYGRLLIEAKLEEIDREHAQCYLETSDERNIGYYQRCGLSSMKGAGSMHRLPTKRPPTHPGEMLLLEFLEPLGLTQVELAERIGVPFQRINQIVKQRRSVTPDTALRFAQLLGTTPEFWLSLQQNWDLYELMSSSAKEISRIKPLKRAG